MEVWGVERSSCSQNMSCDSSRIPNRKDQLRNVRTHSSGGSTNGPMGFERPGSSGESIGLLLKAGVTSNWNCTRHMFSSPRSYCIGVDICREASLKYLKPLCPYYRSLWPLVLYLSSVHKAIEFSQSNCFQLRWNLSVGVHDLELDTKVK